MNAAAFPSPTAEMAEINRIQYELDYTEGISQKMRVPDMLKVAPQVHDGPITLGPQDVHPSVVMQVPDRIVIAGENSNKVYPGPRDLDLIQATPFDPLSLKTPPRVLTLSERPLDFLEDDQRATSDADDTMRPQGRIRRERSASENMSTRHSGLSHNDSALTLSTYEASFDVGADDMTLVDAATLRRQLIKLNRRLQLLEEESKERAKREMILYSVSVAFWLINTWVWLRR